MAAPAHPGWYIQEWFAVVGLKQFDLVTKLDYQRNTAFKLWHGLQEYRRHHVEDVAALLNIRPYELLMPPEEAMRLRRLQSVVAEVAREDAPAPSAVDRTGTEG